MFGFGEREELWNELEVADDKKYSVLILFGKGI